MKNDEKGLNVVPKTTETAKVEIVNDLNNSIEELQKRLKIQLDKLNEKKILADNREVFLSTKEKLQQFRESLDCTGFESKQGKVVLKMTVDSYRDTDILAISNPALLRKFAEIILKEIDIKISEIETLLLNN
jgi:hypothetical protein